MSVEANWIWNADTPCTVPAGARISAGKSGSVARSLPSTAVAEVKRSPVSCMPSPESPAKRTTTRSRTSTVLGMHATSVALPARSYRGQRDRFWPWRRNGWDRRGPELSVIGFGAWEAGGSHWGPNESEEGGHRGDPGGPRHGHQLDRHRRGLRQGRLGDPGGPRDRRPARRRPHRVQGGAGPRRHRLPARAGEAGLRGFAGPPGHRPSRPVPTALAGHDRRARRGDLGRHGRTDGRRRGPSRSAFRTSTGP